MQKTKINISLIGIYSLLCFPLFYFVYKYGTPYLGMIDFFDYYKLYNSLDYKSADSPLNMRLVSSFFVFCMSKIGFVYNTVCQIDGAPFSKVVYFNAIFFNYMCVVLTSTVIFNLIRKNGHSILHCFLGGVVYLLGFGTVFFELMPLTDALSVLLFAVILYYYQKKSSWILVPLIILILQREYVFMALGLLALLDYIKTKDKYYVYTLLACIICFTIYIVLRKTIFETPRYAYHTSSEFMLNSLTSLHFPILPFIRQTLMTMNICLIYLFVVIYKIIKKISFDKFELIKFLALLIQLLILTFLLGLGNNAGRYFYILIPFVIVNLANELKTFKLESSFDPR